MTKQDYYKMLVNESEFIKLGYDVPPIIKTAIPDFDFSWLPAGEETVSNLLNKFPDTKNSLLNAQTGAENWLSELSPAGRLQMMGGTAAAGGGLGILGALLGRSVGKRSGAEQGYNKGVQSGASFMQQKMQPSLLSKILPFIGGAGAMHLLNKLRNRGE